MLDKQTDRDAYCKGIAYVIVGPGEVSLKSSGQAIQEERTGHAQAGTDALVYRGHFFLRRH